MNPEWLYIFLHKRYLSRFFSTLLGLAILILGDGLILVRLAREVGVYFALALEGSVAIIAAIILGSTIHGGIKRIRRDAVEGHYAPGRYARLAGVIVAAILLFLPGFISDAVGILIYLPPGRQLFAIIFQRYNKETLRRVYEYLTLELYSNVASEPSGESEE